MPLKTSCLDESDFDWYDTDARALTPEEKKPSSFFPAFSKESIRDRHTEIGIRDKKNIPNTVSV